MHVSITYMKRRLKCWPETPVAANVQPGCLSNYRAPCISTNLAWSSRGCHQVEKFLEQDCVVEVPSLSPRSCCIQSNSWVGSQHPSSSPLMSSCSSRCSDAAVRLTSSALRVSYGASSGGLRRRPLTLTASSGLRELTTCRNESFEKWFLS